MGLERIGAELQIAFDEAKKKLEKTKAEAQLTTQETKERLERKWLALTSGKARPNLTANPANKDSSDDSSSAWAVGLNKMSLSRWQKFVKWCRTHPKAVGFIIGFLLVGTLAALVLAGPFALPLVPAVMGLIKASLVLISISQPTTAALVTAGIIAGAAVGSLLGSALAGLGQLVAAGFKYVGEQLSEGKLNPKAITPPPSPRPELRAEGLGAAAAAQPGNRDMAAAATSFQEGSDQEHSDNEQGDAPPTFTQRPPSPH
jgi:hypothetical protein